MSAYLASHSCDYGVSLSFPKVSSMLITFIFEATSNLGHILLRMANGNKFSMLDVVPRSQFSHLRKKIVTSSGSKY